MTKKGLIQMTAIVRPPASSEAYTRDDIAYLSDGDRTGEAQRKLYTGQLWERLAEHAAESEPIITRNAGPIRLSQLPATWGLTSIDDE